MRVLPALFALVPLLAWGAGATRLEDLTVMALGAVDGRAVLKSTDGKMQVLKTGDEIPGTQAVITQVLPDRLIVEETVVGPDKKQRKQVVWISKPGAPGGRSSVQRLEAEAPPTPVSAAGISGAQKIDAAPASAPAAPPAKKKK
ncbi:MAG TPA: hypothetical protein VMS40_11955 [Vicinamibacterales bacterium]|nr:hypothetical protein [Vicinamibacterales bacterium]